MQDIDIKDDAKRLVEDLPAGGDVGRPDDRIYVRRAIEAGIEDARAGRTVDVSEVRARYQRGSTIPNERRWFTDLGFRVHELLRYGYGGFLAYLLAAIAWPARAKEIVDALGASLSVLTAFALGSRSTPVFVRLSSFSGWSEREYTGGSAPRASSRHV